MSTARNGNGKGGSKAAKGFTSPVVPVAPAPGGKGALRYEPTEEQRRDVALMVAHGISQPVIARMLGISEDTLQRRFRHELDHGVELATSIVAGSLWRSANNGDVQAQKFWLASRAKWRDKDAPITVNNLGDGDVIIDDKRRLIDEMRARRQSATAEAVEAVQKAAASAREVTP